MNLEELVKYFRKGGSFEEFCISQELDLNSEVIEIYIPDPKSIKAELEFFEIEKTEGRIKITSDGLLYHNLFDFYFFLDAIMELKEKKHENLSDKEIAQKLLSYAIHDA